MPNDGVPGGGGGGSGDVVGGGDPEPTTSRYTVKLFDGAREMVRTDTANKPDGVVVGTVTDSSYWLLLNWLTDVVAPAGGPLNAKPIEPTLPVVLMMNG